MDCAHCEDKSCYEQGTDCTGLADEIRKAYDDELTARIHRVSTELEGNYYGKKNRLEEIIHFAREMGFKKLGIAFCVGFADEARTLADILSKHFEVSSVCCKNCGIMKKDLNLPQIRDDREEAICNPVGQARMLEEDGTELNVLLGLCVGHDTLFHMHTKTPCTTFVAKDRVLGHNPVAALYSRYIRRKFDG